MSSSSSSGETSGPSALAVRCRRFDPQREQRLRHSVAEALATPIRLCDKRICRRNRACRVYDNRTGLPCCIDGASPALRAAYDALLALLLRFEAAIDPGALAGWHGRFGPDPNLRDDQLACIAILFALLPPDDPLHPEFAAFWRQEAERNSGDERGPVRKTSHGRRGRSGRPSH